MAVVLLDGAVEACVSVCLGRFGDAPAERESLADSQKRLERHLHQKGLPGWREVARLRRIRNLTHHHQVPADSATLIELATPVVTYIGEAVRATFGIRLTDIRSADVIVDDDLRKLLTEAEAAVDGGDISRCMQIVNDAFRRASDRWTRSWNGDRFPSNDEMGRAIAAMIENEVGATRDLVKLLPFALDPAEAIWFMTVKSAPDVASEEDARRAIRFAVDWIVRWEAHDELNRSIREQSRRRSVVVVEPSEFADGRPHWADAPAVHELGSHIHVSGTVRWATADTPIGRQAAWRSVLTNLLRSYNSAIQFYGNTVAFTISDKDPADDAGRKVRSMLEGIEASFAATPAAVDAQLAASDDALRAAQEQEAADQRVAQAIFGSVRQATGIDESPFTGVSVTRSQVRNGGRDLRFHTSVRSLGQRPRDKPPIGRLSDSGMPMVWEVDIDTSTDDLVTAAVQVAETLSDIANTANTARTERQRRLEAVSTAVGQFMTSNRTAEPGDGAPPT